MGERWEREVDEGERWEREVLQAARGGTWSCVRVKNEPHVAHIRLSILHLQHEDRA